VHWNRLGPSSTCTRYNMARTIGLFIVCAAVGVHGWVTTSQSVYGAQIDEIKAQMRGEDSTREDIAELGWLWFYPEDTQNNRGLGGGITWAWNPALCDMLQSQFREDVFGGGMLIGCAEMKAAVARAFNKWAANSRYLTFIDVTHECERLGLDSGLPTDPRHEGVACTPSSRPVGCVMPHGGCPLAEIWVTSLNGPWCSSGLCTPESSGRRQLRGTIQDALGRVVDTIPHQGRRLQDGESAALEGGTAVATALPHAQYVTDFRYTNGEKPFYGGRGGPYYNRTVVETFAGTFSFNTADVCWYMDSKFCAPFHELKRACGSPENARLLVWGLTYGLTALALLFYLGLFCNMLMRTTGCVNGMCDDDQEADKDGDGINDADDEDGDGQLSCQERANAVLRTLSHWNPFVLTIFILLLILPPLVTTRIFAPCFDCYDFEAAALHEIGHFLGLGHPDNIPDNWLIDQPAALPKPGNNSYHEYIALAMQNGSRPDVSLFCTTPWEDVRGGVPDGAFIDTDKLGARYPTRDAQMEARTQHNPMTCLMEDDLEGLAVIYPDCDAESALFVAVCHEVNLNIGIVRLAIYILIPSIIALFVIICCTSLVHRFERREKARLMERHEAEKQAMEDEMAANKGKHRLQMAALKLGRALSRKEREKNAAAPPSGFAGCYPSSAKAKKKKSAAASSVSSSSTQFASVVAQP